MKKLQIRDPVHGPIFISELEKKIIDTKAYQRLRHIKQLGFASFVFPAATHTRYIHSLGVCHLAGNAFDHIVENSPDLFSSDEEKKHILRQSLKLACLFHDLGHGPLSHCIEYSMPSLKKLNVKVYGERHHSDRKANHEDYSIKFLTEEEEILGVFKKYSPNVHPYHVACLIDYRLEDKDDFFILKNGLDLRPLLSQIVSSEIDVDRLDYLKRDAYFSGATYGMIEADWLISHMCFLEKDKKAYLALDSQSLLSIEDFLISRMHMHLIVYLHNKILIYEKMLQKYIESKNCTLKVPSDLKEYIDFTDNYVFEHLNSNQKNNEWARRIVEKKPYQTFYEKLYEKNQTDQIKELEEIAKSVRGHFEEEKDFIIIDKSADLGKKGSSQLPIYIRDLRFSSEKLLENECGVFRKYSQVRSIWRLYVKPELKDTIEKKLQLQG